MQPNTTNEYATPFGSTVDAVDLSGRLLALGRSRGAGLPQLSFHQADVTTWTGGPYDVLQCALGIFFLPDMTAATRAMARQLRPGGLADGPQERRESREGDHQAG